MRSFLFLIKCLKRFPSFLYHQSLQIEEVILRTNQAFSRLYRKLTNNIYSLFPNSIPSFPVIFTISGYWYVFIKWRHHVILYSHIVCFFCFNPNPEGVNVIPLLFSLNISETVKTVTCHFAAFSNFSLETLVPNLVSLTRPSLQVSDKNQDKGISNFCIFGESLTNKNCHNFRTSNDINMKLRPVTKLDKGNTAKSKKLPWCPVEKLWGHCYFSNL